MNVTTGMRLLVTILVVGLSFPGISQSDEFIVSPEEQTVSVHRTILNWLECEECTAAQLQAVIRLGPKAVPYLAAALHEGPTVIAVASLTPLLQERYRELKTYQASHPDTPLPFSERDYISFHVSQLTTQYQVRAATALGAIGGPSARLALEQSMGQDLSETARRVVKNALSK